MLSTFGASGLGFCFGLELGLGCLIGLAHSLGLASGLARLFFKPYQNPWLPYVTKIKFKGKSTKVL